jgi:hypothetical protein
MPPRDVASLRPMTREHAEPRRGHTGGLGTHSVYVLEIIGAPYGSQSGPNNLDKRAFLRRHSGRYAVSYAVYSGSRAPASASLPHQPPGRLAAFIK